MLTEGQNEDLALTLARTAFCSDAAAMGIHKYIARCTAPIPVGVTSVGTAILLPIRAEAVGSAPRATCGAWWRRGLT